MTKFKSLLKEENNNLLNEDDSKRKRISELKKQREELRKKQKQQWSVIQHEIYNITQELNKLSDSAYKEVVYKRP